MKAIPSFKSLQDATTYLQEKFNRTDFTCTEIPYQEMDGVVFCICTEKMEYQTASIELDNESITFVFDDMQGNQVICDDLDELFEKSNNFTY